MVKFDPIVTTTPPDKLMTTLYHRLDDSSRGQILKLLQRYGAMEIKDLRRELGMSDTAIRQQLHSLAADGLIRTSQGVAQGPGRPSRLYELSDEARHLFAHYSEDLALNLYAELMEEEGPDRVRRLLERVGKRLAEQYQAQIMGNELQERVLALASILDGKGIMSDVSQEADVIVLHEYNCPYHELASTHREICEMEKDMIAQVLDAEVELTNCMMDGHRGCTFAVRRPSSFSSPPTLQTPSEVVFS